MEMIENAALVLLVGYIFLGLFLEAHQHGIERDKQEETPEEYNRRYLKYLRAKHGDEAVDRALRSTRQYYE